MSNKREGRKLHEKDGAELESRARRAGYVASRNNLKIKHWNQTQEQQSPRTHWLQGRDCNHIQMIRKYLVRLSSLNFVRLVLYNTCLQFLGKK